MKLFNTTFYLLNTWLVPICVMLLSLTMAPVLFAATEEVEMSVMFHVGRCDLDTCLADNSKSIAEIRRFIDMSAQDSSITITRVAISGYASPEGSPALNRRLAQGRMHAMEQIVMEGGKYLCNSELYKLSAVSDLSALSSEITKSDIAGGRQALDILADSVAGTAQLLRRLKTVDNGRLWDEIKPLLNNLRYATVVFTYKRCPAVEVVVEEEIAVVGQPVQEPAFEPVPESEPSPVVAQTVTGESRRKPLYVSLKTNMLYDALLVPSIGAEVYLGKMLSVNANWSYAWWRNDRRHDYWRYYGGDIAVRRWFGKAAAEKPLTGHHIGLYAQIFTYDFELGGKGQMGNKYNYGGGAEYGFSLPISRRLNIDFTLGVGYIGGKYHEYRPIDGHYVWQATKMRHWFGPTKAEVSLVWLIGYGNSNNRKGGAR